MNFDSEARSDVAGAVSIWAHFGEGAQIVFFARGEPVEADTEKALIESANGEGVGAMDVAELDCGTGSGVPGLIAPLLKEIGVTLRDRDDFREGFARKGCSLLACWNLKCFLCFRGAKLTDLGILEQALGVGF